MTNRNKVWILDFCENELDGLVKCYLHYGTVGYRILWERVEKGKNYPELQEQGIYFVVEKSGRGKPHIYVGQGTKRKNNLAMLNRVKEHKRHGEFAWADDVVFLVVPDSLGPTELNYLEKKFYTMIQECGRYDADNAVDPQRGEPRAEIMGLVESVIEDAECLLSIFGHRPFTKGVPSGVPTRIEHGLPRIGKNAFTARMPSGVVISFGKCSETFAETIKQFGAARVAAKFPHLVRQNRAAFPDYASVKDLGNGWFVNVHGSAKELVRILKKISSVLEIGAEIVEG